jgi:hypothetical protein
MIRSQAACVRFPTRATNLIVVLLGNPFSYRKPILRLALDFTLGNQILSCGVVVHKGFPPRLGFKLCRKLTIHGKDKVVTEAKYYNKMKESQVSK